MYDQKTIPLSSGVMNGPSEPTAFICNMESKDPVVLFRLFFYTNIINTIVFQSNLYSQQSGKKFIPTSRVEIETFLGINILMGIKKLPSYRDYWSADEDLNDPYISNLMPVNRFIWLLSHIHLNDNSIMPERNSNGFDKFI